MTPVSASLSNPHRELNDDHTTAVDRSVAGSKRQTTAFADVTETNGNSHFVSTH